MGLIGTSQLANTARLYFRHGARLFLFSVAIGYVGFATVCVEGQTASSLLAVSGASSQAVAATRPVRLQAQRFLAGRASLGNVSAGQAMEIAREQHALLVLRQHDLPPNSNLNAAWQPLGPNQIASEAYGKVTGRVTSIAIDPADATGNTVYVGTTGGGVWKSSNAAGAPGSVTFTALTDTLPVFSANAGSAVTPSLSIGALSMQSGVILAGTGDPNDATDSYYGSGILRSADGGLTWTLIRNSQDGVAGNHLFAGLGFAGFAWNSASPGTVVAAVSQAAEGVLVNAPNATDSVMGLYYSTDAGVTWQMSIIMDGSQTVQTPLPSGGDQGGKAATAVVWNPVRQRFYAAIRFHGYYESPDGVTWTRLANQPGTGLTAANCPTDPGGIAGNPNCPIFRGALAVQATTGDMFALTVDSGNTDQGIWQDVCAASSGSCSSNVVAFGSRLNSTPLEVGSGSTVISQAAYNLSLAAVPAGAGGSGQDTLLYAGTVDLYRCSLNAGCVFRNTTNAVNACNAPAQVAPAQHAIAALATASQPLLYIGNDGGLWRSLDGVNQQAAPCSADDANHFQNLNGGLGSLAEVVSFAQHPADSETLLVGLGANGTAGTATASSLTTAWPQLSTGEGGTVAIDQTNPLRWYVSTAAGVSIRQCTSGSMCTAANFTGSPTIGPSQVSLDDSLIDAPWLLDPALPSNIVVGTCRAWRGPADSGASWSSSNAISKLLAGPQNAACGSGNPVLRSLAAGGPAATATAAENAGSQVLYAGMAGAHDGGGSFGGHLFSTTAANTATNTTAWSDLAASPVINDSSGSGVFNPGAFDLSTVTIDPHDATGNTVYAAVMGFTGNGINAPHLYRSTNAGASWSNISSNLPNSPANGVIVDPNDANTIYIAMDTGIYVTTEVTICSTANCWSVYGTGLPNAPVVALIAGQALPTGDGRMGELRAATYGRGIWQIPLLTASTAVQAAISLSPTDLTFSTQAVATASSPQTITVTNTGDAALSVSQITATGDFSETDTCTASPIAPNLSCAIQVVFAPTVTGARSGVLTVYGNVSGGQATATLNGSATAASAIILDPIAVVFPTTAINATSMAQNITISNTGTSTIALQSPTVSGDFKISANTCGVSLASGVGCTVAVTFTPTASGNRSGTFVLTDGAGTQTATLAGVGTSPATDALSPLALTFGVQQITTSSATQQVVLTNSGDVALTLIAAQITSGDFTVVNSCGNSLNAHSTCSLGVAFQPKDIGPLSGTMTVSDQYRTQTVALNGTGIAPPGVSLAPFSTVAFAPVGVGIAAPAQTVTLTNNQGVALLIQSIVPTGDFSIVPGSNNCGGTVAADASCTMRVVFTPTVGGPRTGTLTVTDSGPNSPQGLQLTGTGVDFTLTADGDTSVTVTSGQSAVFPLLLSSAANVPGKVTFTCSGMPANTTCNITPATVTLGGTTTVSVTVLTGISGGAISSSLPQERYRVVWIAFLLPIGLIAWRRQRLPRLMSCVLLCLLMFGSGCGAGREIPLTGGGGSAPGSGPATPAGTYTIVAGASSAGLTRTISLTLVVQ
jgi:hypothetical protein